MVLSPNENTSTSEVDGGENPTHIHNLNDNIQTNPLDLTVEATNSETINRLKTWVTDCMEAERERRSPSPEFMELGEFDSEEVAKLDATNTEAEMEESQGYDEVDRVSMYNVKKVLTKEQMPTLEEIKEGIL